MTTMLNVKMMTAKANARILRESSQKMARCFVDACIACWQVKEGKQYKDLGYSSFTYWRYYEEIRYRFAASGRD